MLGLLGYDAYLASDAQTALKSLAEGPPDLLMLDVCLPDLDGPKILRIARRLESAGDLPTIAASAVVARGAPEVEELRALGVSEFLAKPFNLPALRRALARAHPQGPCGERSSRSEFALPAMLLWDQGRASADVRGARALSVRFETPARGLHPGLEVQLKLERTWEDDGQRVHVPVRLFGNLQQVRPTEAGSQVEMRVQVAVPREHWLGLCDDALG